MIDTSMGPLARIGRIMRFHFPTKQERAYMEAVRASGLFDPVFYRGAYPGINGMYQRDPLRHYVLYGEARGFRPNPDFSPVSYMRYNLDVARTGMGAFHHYVVSGQHEDRITKEMADMEGLPRIDPPVLRFGEGRAGARFAVAVHVYYSDLWPEFARTLERLPIAFDLYVTLTYRGDKTDELAETIRAQFPSAVVVPFPNRGRDLLPFVMLVNSGAFDGYEAVCKLHTKKSPHREDGEHWRRHLIAGILPETGLQSLLDRFIEDEGAAFWVADGQHYESSEWWGSNFEVTQSLMRRLEVEITRDALSFPAGSIYWMKPLMVSLLKSMSLRPEDFASEQAQVDGTLAHGLERAMGFLASSTGQGVRQTSQLLKAGTRREGGAKGTAPAMRPAFTSAFYLPQFHPIPENDAWWGRGFTEWRGTVTATSLFEGHTQPLLPSDLGFYDLRVTDVMGQQAALATEAGIDAFCVYHYWFDGRRVLEQPLDRLLERPDVNFPFYLCWANESWRRNWDGLSGEVLLDQTYAPGFEAGLVADSLPYMRDGRYARPDGTRPRFVIYRPEDMPDPAGSVARLRAAWREAGIDAVELGAVCFHVDGENPVADDLFDFWIEMPPHGMVKPQDYLFGGPQGDILDRDMQGDFSGLVYDYTRLRENAIDPEYVSNLPENTICGIMPSWDNTARRGTRAHIAYGANPAQFGIWLEHLRKHRLPGSYRNEMFLNAWNEWAEKAVLEPSMKYGALYLETLRRNIAGGHPSPRKGPVSGVGATAKDEGKPV
jgi:lipopolysaccharide biosynthesis protein